jgi:hypothetical protein
MVVPLEITEGAIENGQSRETVNIGYTRRRNTHTHTHTHTHTISGGHQYTPTNANNVNKT